jgi:hypothetical protein
MRPLLTDMLDFSATSAGSTLPVFDGLVANNTSSATTLILDYGVSVIETATPTNFACKLPQPTTGRTLFVINKSNLPVSLFPSNDGGQINNYPVNTPAIIPPDGRSYIFICVENPLPGAWVWSPPAIAQYDSGEIEVTTTTSVFASTIAAASINGTIYAAERSGASSFSGLEFDGLNKNIIAQNQVPDAYPNSNYFTAFKPATPWNGISKIKVYTNIVPDIVEETYPAFNMSSAARFNTYQANTTTFIAPGTGAAVSPFLLNSFPLQNVIAGTSPPPLTVTSNIGDAGTAWGERVTNTSSFDYFGSTLSFIGDQFISTNGTVDTWFTRTLSLFLQHRVIGTVKFRVFLEYF